jgi:hypothetical protein
MGAVSSARLREVSTLLVQDEDWTQTEMRRLKVRVMVDNDAGQEIMVFETDGSNSTYPFNEFEQKKAIDALTKALIHLMQLKKGLLDGEI